MPPHLFEMGAGFEYRLRSEEHTSELQSHLNLVCRLLLEKKKKTLEIQLASSTCSGVRPPKTNAAPTKYKFCESTQAYRKSAGAEVRQGKRGASRRHRAN